MKKVYAIDIIDTVFFDSIEWWNSVKKAIPIYFQGEMDMQLKNNWSWKVKYDENMKKDTIYGSLLQ